MKRSICCWILLAASIFQIGCSSSGSDSDTDAGSAGDMSPDIPLTPDPMGPINQDFMTFDTGQVRPLALAADGSRLFATNTPNSTLDIFTVNNDGLVPEFSVPVGMEPVSVALFGDEQAWVVNHLSDSVSVVDLTVVPPRVVKTLLVGDEPRDIVFAGDARSRAFITTAHRGQNGPDDLPIDAELFTPSVGRADVWVFDADNTGDSLGGDPLTVLTMFGDTPRALTTSPDGQTVFAAVMHSGNQTTTLGENRIAKSGPVQSSDGVQQPDTGLIVQFDGSNWRDETGQTSDLNATSYDSLVRFSLPDYDVFVINASDSPMVVDQYSGVGTTLFNMISNPVTGTVYVSNSESNNLTRFEGEGNSSTTLRGDISQSRITILDGDQVLPRNLNKHLDHTQDSATEAQRRLAMAQPLGMAISGDGSTLYVAGFGSDNIAVYDTTMLENDSFAVSEASQIDLNAGGPTGLVFDESRGRLYAYTRFNNSIATVDTNSNTTVASVPLFNPEPPQVVRGRPFLYNATELSSHGDASCASCHIFGDLDGLAWDLGNPDDVVVSNPNAFVNFFLAPDEPAIFHPLKGPMTTQSLRGLANNGPMHWRGDRTGASAEQGQSLEHAAFSEFNGAFPALLGSDSPLSTEQMSAFADFALEIQYPPNPIRALDNSLSVSQLEGRRIYMEDSTTGRAFTCDDCHRLDPLLGQFGTAGRSTVEGEDISQEFKVPHLRNMYQKVGKFGNTGRFSGTETDFGDQIKGFGFMHDGNMDTLDNFLQGSVFRFAADDESNDRMRAQVVDFVMAFDSDLAPIVGQQVTVDANSGDSINARLDLLLERAAVTTPIAECDLIAKGVVEGQSRGYLLTEAGIFQSDRTAQTLEIQELRELAVQNGSAMTFTCVPPGSGRWMGIDRNVDGVLDGDAG